MPPDPAAARGRLEACRRALERSAAHVALLALVVFLFRDAVFGGRVFFERDLHVIWFEQARAFAYAVATRSWPVWDPFQGFGQPMLANPNRQVLYPLTWLHAFMDPWRQYTVAVVVQFALSAWGQLALSRRLRLSPWAGVLAGALWVASGPHVSLVNVWNHLSGAVWIPWALVFADRLLKDGGRNNAFALAAVVALQVFAGSPEMSVFTLAICAALVAWRLWRCAGRRPRMLLSLLAALALALSLSAAQWLPTLAALPRTVRVVFGPTVAAAWATAPQRLPETALPLARCEEGAAPRDCVDRNSYLDSLYLGALSFPLVVAALASRRKAAFGLASLALVALGWAVGPRFPLYPAALHLLPPLTLLRYPEKAVVLVAFAWSLLAGIGLDALASKRVESEPARRAALAGSAILVGFYAAWTATRAVAPPPALLVGAAAVLTATLLLARPRTSATASAAALAIVAIGELSWVTSSVNPTAPRELVAPPPLVARIVAADAPSRVCALQYDEASALRYLGRRGALMYVGVPLGWTEAMAGAHVVRETLFPPLAGAFGLYGSYDGDVGGFLDRRQARLTDLLAAVLGTPRFERLLQRTAVSHLIALHERDLPGLALLARRQTLLPEPVNVFRVPGHLPRAFAVARARRVDPRWELSALVSEEFDPIREVLLAEADPAPSARRSFQADVRLGEQRADRVRLQTQLAEAGYVVLLDAFDPGWRATIDGRPATVKRANVGFRAVRVPAGRHELELRYRPTSVIAGVAWSAAAIVFVAGASAWTQWRRRRPLTSAIDRER